MPLKNAEGEPYLSDAGKRPIFTVNRSYSVQQQFKYGYIAKMKSDEVTEQLVKEIITSTNKGFNKKQIFENTMTANLDTVLKFEWTSNFSTEEHQYNAEKIEEIKQAVFVKFVDDYFDKLVQAGVLEIVQPTNVEEADGGYADVTKEGYACWTKRSLFSKRTHCGNYTYVVKEWFDGITDKELNDKLTINSTFTEEMQVNEMAPFYYSSTFIK